jgi:hypothetical protein
LNLTLHYCPGARGDFLASVIFDSVVENKFGSVKRPYGFPYKNVHVTEDYSFLDNSESTFIRIPTGLVSNGIWTGISSKSALQVAHNWMSKHPMQFSRNPHYMTMDTHEQYYHCVHFFCFDDTVADQYKEKYSYRIEFDKINNLYFLNDFRTKLMGSPVSEQTMEAMKTNINNQQPWDKSENAEIIEQVRQLIDQELESGVFLGPTWDHVPVADKLALLKG